MPSLTGKKISNAYKRLLQINQSSNTGVDATTRNIQDGDGNSTALNLSDDAVEIKPINDNASPFIVRNKGGDAPALLEIDALNTRIKVNGYPALIMTKEMALYGFRPSDAGYHYPLIANTGSPAVGAAFLAENDFGNGTDPPTTVDVSGLTAIHMPVAIYWYLDYDITLHRVRYTATSEASDTLNFHLFSYDLDTTSNHGDLSNGTVVASATVDVTATTVKTGAFTLDSANIDANKVVIGFVEDVSAASDISVAFNIHYNFR